MNTRLRNFMWTLNNYTEDDITVVDNLIDLTVNGKKVFKYIVYQREEGLNGTLHLQGYAELENQKTLGALKKINGTVFRMHIEKRMGTQKQAIDYCTKTRTRLEGTEPKELGEKRKQGKKEKGSNDFTKCANDIKNGMTWNDIMDNHGGTFIRCPNGVRKLFNHYQPDRNEEPDIRIYYGKTGYGKSRTARVKYPNAYRCAWPTGGRWWFPNYNGEKIIIMDEWRHQVKMDILLQLFDWGHYWIEDKGSSMRLQANKFIITTNIPPHKWYPKKTPEEAAMLHRRIEEFGKIYEFDEPTVNDEGQWQSNWRVVSLQDREPAEVLVGYQPGDLLDFSRNRY